MRLAGAGWELAFAIVGFAGVGFLVGSLLGSARWGLLIGAILGVVGGLYNLVKSAIGITRDTGRDQSG
ncbi:MAG: AtpZ/AtpI family protein [Thermoanaerobaculia bacterium]|nr:AtpZ/AtpI family protein [Thermoanaerobaculia bacterium]